ncbi:MAG: spore cortex-lytic protein, partial [Clostridium sp.]
MSSIGRLQVQVLKGNSSIPISNAEITISRTVRGMREQVSTLTTSQEGQSPVVDLEAPPVELSLNKDNKIMPYGLYDILVKVPGYDNLEINGCQILSDETAIQVCNMQLARISRETGEAETNVIVIDIQPNRQYGDFPPKIPEDPNKPLPPPPSGLVVLPEPVVPEYIIVHAGTPSNSSAPNYKVPYRDYIKNVASSEIYATWTEA